MFHCGMLIRTQCTLASLWIFEFCIAPPTYSNAICATQPQYTSVTSYVNWKQTLIEAATAAHGLVYMMHAASIEQHLFIYHRISEGKLMSVEDNLKKEENGGNISGKGWIFQFTAQNNINVFQQSA